MPQIDLSFVLPPLPEGWNGTPDELAQFIVDNIIASVDGELPSGQIGGAIPTEDVGIYYGTNSIERYIDGKYRPISDVPIGSVFMFAGTGGIPPANYLFCSGQSLVRADYAELFAVIGSSYGTESGTTFNVPDYRGRAPRGVGVGDYAKQGVTGKIEEVVMGAHGGFEFIRNTAKAPNAPTTSHSIQPGSYFGTTGTNITSAVNPFIGQQFIIRYR